MDRPEFGIPSDFLSNENRDFKFYLKRKVDVAWILGADPDKAVEESIQVINFEKELAKVIFLLKSINLSLKI